MKLFIFNFTQFVSVENLSLLDLALSVVKGLGNNIYPPYHLAGLL